MADAQAKLAAALRKRPTDDEEYRPPAAAPSAAASASQLKLRKSNLLGVVTWEDCLAQLELNGKNEYGVLKETLDKMFGNVLGNPNEPKFRKIRTSNANFVAKVWSCKGAPELFKLCGWKDTVEEGFVVLPEDADLAKLRRAVEALAAQAAARAEADEKKRQEQRKKEAAAREARAQKAADEAAPAQYDAAAAAAANSAMMVDEDEAMLEAVEAYMDAHPEAKAGRPLDAYAIERQVAGPGGTVVASVAASAGTEYFDYVAYMKRGAGGAWSVQKVEGA